MEKEECPFLETVRDWGRSLCLQGWLLVHVAVQMFNVPNSYQAPTLSSVHPHTVGAGTQQGHTGEGKEKLRKTVLRRP